MLKKLFPFIGQYKKYAILSPLCVTAESICELLLPLLMAVIIDDGIGQNDLRTILWAGFGMLVLSCISMTTGTLAAKYASYGAQGFGANLRRALFEKVNDFSFANIDHFSSASLITRITNDVNQIQLVVSMSLRMLIRAPVMLIAALIIALCINARLALILLVAIPLLAGSVCLLMLICHKLFQLMQRRIDALNETVQENLVAIRVVKAFVRAGYEKTKFRKANDALTQAGLQAVMRIVLLQPIMILGISCTTLAVLWFGGNMVLGGTMLIGQLTSFINYIFNILFSVLMVAFALLQLTRAMASASRIIEVLDTEPDIQDGSLDGSASLPASKGQVEFRDVSFKYVASGTGDDVLEHISFTAQPGQVAAIVGGTGVGKSSLVNLIPRFYDVTGGQVLLDGVDVRDYPLEELRGRIGMVLQNNVLFSGTIRENLMWGREDATEEEMIQAAKNAQAYDFIMSFPQGFDTYIEQGGVNVSGGQKQRLCIARAMLRHPAVLILDDSTSAVDSATEALIRESFRENLKDTTVILIAQRISSVQDADQIIILDDGTVAGTGTHDQLLAGNKIYQEIYYSQQEGVRE